jgi:heme oxygenase
MNVSVAPAETNRALLRLRAATGAAHRTLEQSLDAVRRLADPVEREALLPRYAAFHIPADAALRPYLDDVAGLDLAERSRAPLLARFAKPSLPDFPKPDSAAEALGMLYVLEGSTLGGRIILRMLADRGVRDERLGFLDPYGRDTGARWRSFCAVLDQQTRGSEAMIEQACRGGVAAFDHARTVLCGRE